MEDSKDCGSSPGPADTHGHHTASAMLAVQAFHAAADPKFHPEQLTGDVTPETPVSPRLPYAISKLAAEQYLRMSSLQDW